MKNEMKLIVLFAISILILSNNVIAQPFRGGEDKMRNGHSSGGPMHKIETMKKMKLLEYLDLNEDLADKFLAKYTIGTKNIMDCMKKADDISDKLRDAIKDNPASNDAVSLTNELIKAQKCVDDAKAQNIENMRTILPPEKFTKFVFFEANFQKEVMKRMMQKNKENEENERPFRKRD